MYPYDDASLKEVELGASIFVKANKNLWRASEEFGFERADFEDESSVVGFWDGEHIVFTVRSTRRFRSWVQAFILTC